MTPAAGPLLHIRDLAVEFGETEARSVFTKPRTFRALDGVDLTLTRGETLGLIGESGSGKTTLGKAIVGLIPTAAGQMTPGETNLTELDPGDRRSVARRVQMVFHDPYASLHPRQTIGQILAEPLKIHRAVPRNRVAGVVSGLLERVGLSSIHAHRHPQHFSGGQRQRIAIARAIATDPDLIIADEPVSALDVSIQAQILNLLDDLRREHDMTMLFISHDLSVVRHVCQRIAVMYLGRIVEIGPTDALIAKPAHPYTRALLSAVPRIGSKARAKSKPIVLSGDIPSHSTVPNGCPFHTRCWLYEKKGRPERCRRERPALRETFTGRQSACFYPEETSSSN